MEWPNVSFGPATKTPPSPDQAISPKGTRHPSLEPAIPTGRELLAQLNQLTEECAFSGNNSNIDGGRERINPSNSRPEPSSSKDGAQTSGNVDDSNVATSLHQLTPPHPAPPTLMPHSTPLTLEHPSSPPALAPPANAASTSVVEAPVSSRLRTRPEKSQHWKDSVGIDPKQEKGQSKKRKAPKETQEPAKRAKTDVDNTTTTTTKRVAARSAGAKSRKNKQQVSKSKAATRVEFPNLIIPKTESSLSDATPAQSKAETISINNIKKHRATLPELSKSAAAVKVAAKKAVPKNAAAKKRAREEHGEDEEDGRTAPVKRLRVAKALKAPKPRKIINHAPTQKLDVFVCGDGSSGELGLGNATDVKCPCLNNNLSASRVGVVHIAVGGMHTAALTHDGLIYTWGLNDHGALGRDTRRERIANYDMDVDGDEAVDLNPFESTPMPIPSEHFPSDIVFTQLACGDSTTFALTNDGEVWGWGTFRRNDGILGFSKDVKIQSTPAKLPNLSNVKQIVCGANHAMALREDGQVFIWGSGEQNQLGHRVLERKHYDSLIPTPLRLNKKCRLIGCGIDHSFVVEKNKEDVWTWGPNRFGETGVREANDSNKVVIVSPVRVPTLSLNGDTISTITGGSHHSVAITTNGKLLVWGRLDGHQLGMDPNSFPDAELVKDSSGRPRILIQPTELPTTAIGTAKFVAAGHDHNIAINTAGEAYSWGFNFNHQCGQGASSDGIDEPTHIENTAVRNRELAWAGCGGEFSIMAAVAEGDNGVE